MPAYVKAKMGFIQANGRHGPYLVCYIELFRDFRGTIPITVSLSPDVWKDEFIPQKRRDEGMDILLRRDMIFRKRKGWRAMWARMFRPEDEKLLTEIPKLNQPYKLLNSQPPLPERGKFSKGEKR
jgi:hypothetical protein